MHLGTHNTGGRLFAGESDAMTHHTRAPGQQKWLLICSTEAHEDLRRWTDASIFLQGISIRLLSKKTHRHEFELAELVCI